MTDKPETQQEPVEAGSGVEREVRRGRWIRWFSDPAIGFPWLGEQGAAIIFRKTGERGFGVWIHRERYTFPTLRIALWWTVDFEWRNWCA